MYAVARLLYKRIVIFTTIKNAYSEMFVYIYYANDPKNDRFSTKFYNIRQRTK